jgi:hypothetical protein
MTTYLRSFVESGCRLLSKNARPVNRKCSISSFGTQQRSTFASPIPVSVRRAGVSDVPSELQRQFQGMRELDEKVAALEAQVTAQHARPAHAFYYALRSVCRCNFSGMQLPGTSSHSMDLLQVEADCMEQLKEAAAVLQETAPPPSKRQKTAAPAHPVNEELARRIERNIAEMLKLSEEKVRWGAGGDADPFPPPLRLTTKHLAAQTYEDAPPHTHTEPTHPPHPMQMIRAQQIYDQVDAHIRKLDKDLRAFDAEVARDRQRLGLPALQVSHASSAWGSRSIAGLRACRVGCP